MTIADCDSLVIYLCPAKQQDASLARVKADKLDWDSIARYVHFGSSECKVYGRKQGGKVIPHGSLTYHPIYFLDHSTKYLYDF